MYQSPVPADDVVGIMLAYIHPSQSSYFAARAKGERLDRTPSASSRCGDAANSSS
jgi:hypothetical protein